MMFAEKSFEMPVFLMAVRMAFMTSVMHSFIRQKTLLPYSAAERLSRWTKVLTRCLLRVSVLL